MTSPSRHFPNIFRILVLQVKWIYYLITCYYTLISSRIEDINSSVQSVNGACHVKSILRPLHAGFLLWLLEYEVKLKLDAFPSNNITQTELSLIR